MSAKSKTLTLDSVENVVSDLKDSELNSKAALRDLWWLFTLRGLLLIALGFMAMAWPGITLVVLSFLFAVFLLAQGVVSIVAAFRSLANNRAWFLRLVLGFLEVSIGVYLLASDAINQVGLFVIYLGIMFFIEGVVGVVEAFAGNKDGGHRVLLTVGGLLGVLAGLILMRYPVTAGVTFTWVIGLYGIIAGALGFVYGLSLRSSK